MAMPPIQTFKGFFSYAHLDATASPGLIDALTVDLESLVTAKLLNAGLAIWRDRTHLRTGDRWDPAIEGELRGSDILIVLVTPSWIQSDFCRKEYLVFEEVEGAYGGGGYIVPILARSVESQERHLTPAQRLVYESIGGRQYFPMLAADFLARDADGR
jgi:TIR domain